MVPVLIKVIALISLSFFQFAQASYIAYISILHDLPPLSEGSANPVCCVIFYLLLRPLVLLKLVPIPFITISFFKQYKGECSLSLSFSLFPLEHRLKTFVL